MRGEAGATRGKTAGRSSSNYPPISAAYWLPPSNPTPYHVPGSKIRCKRLPNTINTPSIRIQYHLILLSAFETSFLISYTLYWLLISSTNVSLHTRTHRTLNANVTISVRLIIPPCSVRRGKECFIHGTIAYTSANI